VCVSVLSYATLVVCRLLGGLSTAGGSVTLGVVADMWLPDDQEYAVAFLVLSSVGGSVVGPVIGKSSARDFGRIVHLLCESARLTALGMALLL
jgi:MFS family permease